jgi:hypothetical protein
MACRRQEIPVAHDDRENNRPAETHRRAPIARFRYQPPARLQRLPHAVVIFLALGGHQDRDQGGAAVRDGTQVFRSEAPPRQLFSKPAHGGSDGRFHGTPSKRSAERVLLPAREEKKHGSQRRFPPSGRFLLNVVRLRRDCHTLWFVIGASQDSRRHWSSQAEKYWNIPFEVTPYSLP